MLAPDWVLYYWSWEKTKLMATFRVSTQNDRNVQMHAQKEVASNLVTQISFNPADSSQIVLVGNGSVRFLRYTEGILKLLPIQKMEPRYFRSHCWTVDDRLIVGLVSAEF